MVIGDRGYLEAELLWRHGGVAPTNEAMTRQRSAAARRVVRALLPTSWVPGSPERWPPAPAAP